MRELSRLFRRHKVGPDWASFRGSDIDRISLYEPYCSWPDDYYQKTSVLAQMVNAQTVVEIGVAYGYHARYLLTQLPAVHYIGIDPYKPDYDSADPFADNTATLFQDNPEAALDRLHSAVKSRLSNEFSGRFELWRTTSHEGHSLISDASVDFVFIDGDHRYDAVLQDLRDWWPKVRPGGVLVGDDYSWPDVRQAVQVFREQSRARVLTVGEPRNSHVSFCISKV